VRAIRELESKTTCEGVTEPPPPNPRLRAKGKGKGKAKGKGKGAKKKGRRSALTQGSISPLRDFHPVKTRTPVSHARSGRLVQDEQEEEVDVDEGQEWARQWGHSFSAEELQAVMKQDQLAGPSTYQQPDSFEQEELQVPEHAETPPSSDPTEPDVQHPPQRWVGASSSTQTWVQPQDTYDENRSTPWPYSWQELSFTPPEVDHLGAEEATVAAESLLNLHSTPLRPTTTTGTETETGIMRPTSQISRLLLAAPEISTTPQRPQPIRARSFIQPFARARPEAPIRSLSFSASLDDPFALSPLPPFTTVHKTIVHSPSPLQLKRKTGPSPSPVQPLRARPENHLYTTPLRRTPMHIPSSVWQESIICSPNADMAARLGLAPSALIVTPGLSEKEGRKRTRMGEELGSEVRRG